MSHSIIISDIASAPVFKLAKNLHDLSDVSVAALTSDAKIDFKGENRPTVHQWSKKSSLGAVTAVRHADAALENTDCAIVVFSPAIGKRTKEFSLSETERIIDHSIKAFVLLFREIDQLFKKNPEATLIPVLFRNTNQLSPLDRIAASAFAAAADNLIAEKQSAYRVLAIDSGSLDFSQIEPLILDQVNNPKKGSRWLKPDAKSNFKSFFSNKRF